MKLWHLYLRKGAVILPHVARTDSGLYMDIDPVAVVEVVDEPDIIREIKVRLAAGNPLIANLARAAFPKPVVLGPAGVKSWATFEKTAKAWNISEKDAVLKLHPQRKSVTRGWEDDPSRVEAFTGIDATDRLIEAVIEQIRLGS